MNPKNNAMRLKSIHSILLIFVGFFLLSGSKLQAGGDPRCYLLRNHPDGAVRPPLYGLRLDELFDASGGSDFFTFDFEHPDSQVRLKIEGGRITISGSVYGGLDNGNEYGDQHFRGLWGIDFTYDRGVKLCPNDDDTCIDTVNFANHGHLNPPAEINNGETIDLYDYRGPFTFSFRLGNEDNDLGHRGFNGISGWGWLTHHDQQHIEASDWIFTALSEPCDRCPKDPDKTDPGKCGCGVPDHDSDGDTQMDCIDTCPYDPDNDADGDGVCGDTDDCPVDTNKTEPGACGCGVPDTDSDGDGVPNCNDPCPQDSLNDVDGDGVCANLDNCPYDPSKTSPGQCGCFQPDTDSDGDGIADCNDTCPDDANNDADRDGTCTPSDGCPEDPAKIVPGACGCGIADVDSDGDGAEDCVDICPNDSQNDQDGDSLCDSGDGCPLDPQKSSPGVCGCGVSDVDGDGDGTPNCQDACASDPDDDADGDQVCGDQDGCPSDANKQTAGICGCGVSDEDTDQDGTPDCNDLDLTQNAEGESQDQGSSSIAPAFSPAPNDIFVGGGCSLVIPRINNE